jgi:DNA-binding transcriptional MerR regulator
MEDGEYKASDLLKLVGLTYRQLHDWEERAGVMASERATAEGWRKFTGKEVMALAICAEIRNQFSIPLEQIRTLYRWLVGHTPSKVNEITTEIARFQINLMENNPKIAPLLKLSGDALREALKDEAKKFILLENLRHKINLSAVQPVIQALQLARTGQLVYLYTDFTESLILTEHNFAKWIAMRAGNRPAVLCPLNDILNALLEKAGEPKCTLDEFGPSFLQTWQKLNDRPDLTAAERAVVQVIRERDYQRVTAHVKDGEVIRLEQEVELADGDQTQSEQKILTAINSGDHQSVTVVKCDGKIVRIGRKTSIKLDKATGTT